MHNFLLGTAKHVLKTWIEKETAETSKACEATIWNWTEELRVHLLTFCTEGSNT